MMQSVESKEIKTVRVREDLAIYTLPYIMCAEFCNFARQRQLFLLLKAKITLVLEEYLGKVIIPRTVAGFFNGTPNTNIHNTHCRSMWNHVKPLKPQLFKL